MIHRVIKSKIENDVVVVDTLDFGYEIHYKIIPDTFVYPDEVEGYPHFSSGVKLQFIEIVKKDNAKTIDEVRDYIKRSTIIPPDLSYEQIFLGFVYGIDGELNNHRWWLDFRDVNNRSVYNYYADYLKIDCPTTTTKWHDTDPDGIWHGRMVFSKSQIKQILESKPGRLVITGNKINSSNKDNPDNIPDKTESLRLRYNIREDIWFCDMLDRKDKIINSIPVKALTIDAKMHSEISLTSNKPQVSTIIKRSDVSSVDIAINNLIIRGK